MNRLLVLASSLVFIPCCSFSAALLAGEKETEAPPVAAESAAPQQEPRIPELIQQLGSSEFLARRRAEKALERLGFEAFDALKEAEQNPDIEIATAARYLASRIKVEWVRENDPPEVKQLFSGYESLSDDQREHRLKVMSKLPKDAGFIALCRVIRFESSAILSKQAALLALNLAPEQKGAWGAREKTVKKELAASQRAPAEWLRNQIQFATAGDREAAVLENWAKFTAAEKRLLKANTGDSSRQIVSGLLRHRSHLLRLLGQKEAAKALLVELIALEEGELDSLLQLVEWLSEDEAWDLIDQVAQKFEKQFESEPILLYTLAELKLKHGLESEANELARRAKELAGENGHQHLRMAFQLQHRGLFRWAEQEYKEVIRIDKGFQDLFVRASYLSAEMLHDMQREKDAGDTLTALTSKFQKFPQVKAIVLSLNLEPAALQSRAEYFLACDQESKKAFAEQRKHLEKAIEYDPTDADVIIAMYRFAKADEKFKEKTMKLIEEAADQFRQDIDSDPDNPQGYNQYAWLISNTEGDYDEAVRFSHRSLELAPDRAGYLDTLGRCYYAVGDLENAIKYQSKAVELEPHSLVIGRQLKFFQSEQEKAREKESEAGPSTPEPSPQDSTNND